MTAKEAFRVLTESLLVDIIAARAMFQCIAMNPDAEMRRGHEEDCLIEDMQRRLSDLLTAGEVLSARASVWAHQK